MDLNVKFRAAGLFPESLMVCYAGLALIPLKLPLAAAAIFLVGWGLTDKWILRKLGPTLQLRSLSARFKDRFSYLVIRPEVVIYGDVEALKQLRAEAVRTRRNLVIVTSLGAGRRATLQEAFTLWAYPDIPVVEVHNGNHFDVHLGAPWSARELIVRGESRFEAKRDELLSRGWKASDTQFTADLDGEKRNGTYKVTMEPPATHQHGEHE